jgi:hypothetical protein
MIPGATIPCVQLAETENAFAICHDEEKSGTTGTVICDGDGKNQHSRYGKSQASLIAKTDIR